MISNCICNGNRTMANEREGTVALNNYLQSKDQLAALSWEESASGPAHTRLWTVVCKLNGEAIATGTGSQKHVAKDMAANAALEILTAEQSS